MRFFSFIFLISASVAVPASESIDILQEYFPNQISIENNREIRFCPDNTCEIFKMYEPEAPIVFEAFVYFYLFHSSDYLYLRNDSEFGSSFRKNTTDYEHKLRQKYSGFCEQESIDIDCILESMQEKLDISVYFSRSDEGAENEVRIK